MRASSHFPLFLRTGLLLGASGMLCLAAPGPAEGRIRHLSKNGDLQQALDLAVPGDTIVLDAKGVYTGNFILRAKQGEGVITIQSQAIRNFPENQRISPEFSKWMPKLISPNVDPVIRTEEGAHNYTFVGIEFGVAENVYTYALIRLGSSAATTVEAQPYGLVFDRVYVHGDPSRGGKRGVELNAGATTISNSYFADFKSSSQDAQAIAGWNGPGPYLIFNNYLEASGMSVLFGGAAAKIPDLVPTDITFQNNYVSRPLDWKGKWSIKNLFELKNARNVDISFNVFENNWVSSQNGTAILFTVRTCEGGNYPWAVVENVSFTHNVVRRAEGGGVVTMGQDNVRTSCATPGTGQVQASGTLVTGQDTKFTEELQVDQYLVINKTPRRIVKITDNASLEVASRFSADPIGPAAFGYFSIAGRLADVQIKDNLFEDIRPLFEGSTGSGRLFQIYAKSENVTINHNTGFQSGQIVMADGAPSPGFVFTNNITPHNRYGIMGSGTGTGIPTIDAYLPGATVTSNIMVGGPSKSYPEGNYFPATMDQVGFVDYASGNYALADNSPYKGLATDPEKSAEPADPGLDMGMISQVLQEAVSGKPTSEGPSFSALRRRLLSEAGSRR